MRIRIHNTRQSKYLYAISKHDALRVKFIGLTGILSLIALSVGFYMFSTQSLLITILCAPFFIVVILYHLVNFWLMLLYPGFDTKKHRQLVATFAKEDKVPNVAVFIPAAGEDLQIVTQTVRGALRIDYPSYDVYLLDDSKDGMYRHMVNILGAKYIRRRATGLHKKAGNMNAAMKRIRGYSHILVLDADFVPRPEILKELTPYASDDTGIVQSPQHFELSDKVYNRSKIEFGAGMIQRDFYRLTQVARDRLGGAICVGTNALYNMTALKKVGGFECVGRKSWGHSEDVNTGLKMINTINKRGERYKIKYIPIQLATGICPSDHLSFYKQQNRWATGSMQLIFSRKTLFSNMLSVGQKVTYFSNSIYYFYTIGLLFAPIQLLILTLMPRVYDWKFTLLFLPMLFVTYILTPFLLRQKIEPVAASVVVISNAYTFVQALWLLLIRRPLGWEATGAKTAPKKRHAQFRAMKFFSSGIFITVYLLTLGTLLVNYDFGFNPSTFIAFVFLASFIGHIIYLHHMLAADIKLKRVHLSRHAYGYSLLAVLIVATIATGTTYRGRYEIKYTHGISLAKVKDLPKVNPPNHVKSIAVSTKNIKQAPEVIAITALPNDSESSIATRVVENIISRGSIDRATAGKLQDKLMHQMGYGNTISAGTEYKFTVKDVYDLTRKDAWVRPDEIGYWSQYAADVGIGE